MDKKLRPMSPGFSIDRPIQPVPETACDRVGFPDAYLAKYPEVARVVRENAFASGIQ
ncbi:hypothetical protein P0D88_47030 [Paraburkholderia sp. RL18-103-BIB-C]|jgi:phytanoyl-CoA hydroxylase|uniref:hypothetical protein n=1 Tax=unclassified Paraburkholderia TaxID=2615204 RepID=UPI002F80BD10